MRTEIDAAYEASENAKRVAVAAAGKLLSIVYGSDVQAYPIAFLQRATRAVKAAHELVASDIAGEPGAEQVQAMLAEMYGVDWPEV